MNGWKKTVLLAVLSFSLFALRSAEAILSYSYGFETVPYPHGTADYFFYTNGFANSQVASGGGTLHLPASEGNYYIEVPRTFVGGFPADQVGGYTFYGGAQSGYAGNFFLSIDMFVDTTWLPPILADGFGFVLDYAPRNVVSNASDFGAEHQFQFFVPSQGTVQVRNDDTGSVFATITESGWYRFMLTYEKSGNLTTDPVVSDFFVFDHNDQLVGSVLDWQGDRYMPSSELGGNSYGAWSTLWQSGFAGNVLAFDNIQAGILPIPEPSTVTFAVAGLVGLGYRLRRRTG